MKRSKLHMAIVVAALAGMIVPDRTRLSHAADTVTPPGTTLWKFLGIPQNVQRVRDGVSNRYGNRPWMERRPSVKPLNHPENLESQNPAIKRAAEIKQQEDLARQKIKAVKYLAKIGCGCYDKDGSVTAALVAALEDCTASVRRETIEAVLEATKEGACTTCNQKCCCNEELVKKLYELGYEKDDEGCWIEPDDRIREMAREAMMACCPGGGPTGPIYEEPYPGPAVTPVPGTTIIPEGPDPLKVRPEGPGRVLPLPEGPPDDPPPIPPTGPPAVYFDESGAVMTFQEYRPDNAAHAHGAGAFRYVGQTEPISGEGFSEGAVIAPQSASASPVWGARGTIVETDGRNGTIHVQWDSDAVVPVGETFAIDHEYLVGRTRLGRAQVIQSQPGSAIARPVDGALFNKMRRGDSAVYTRGG